MPPALTAAGGGTFPGEGPTSATPSRTLPWLGAGALSALAPGEYSFSPAASVVAAYTLELAPGCGDAEAEEELEAPLAVAEEDEKRREDEESEEPLYTDGVLPLHVPQRR